VIDTHCHLGDAAFADDREAVVVRMHEAGVTHALVVESDLNRMATTEAWVRTHPGLGFTTGCHPHDASRWSVAVRDALVARWSVGGCQAAGEIGLDYHYDHAPRDTQRRVFAEQLALAQAAGLPVVIHARDADADVCEAGLEAGWYFSFSGMVSFRNWRDHDTVRLVPSDRLLVETDAPYLAPVPNRGKRNEPAFLPATVAALAAIRGEAVEAVARATTHNALRLFWPNAVP
jgi:TatD DNase family protein